MYDAGFTATGNCIPLPVIVYPDLLLSLPPHPLPAYALAT